MQTTAVSRTNLEPGLWDTAVDEHVLGWWWHTSHWIDYSLAYTPGATDASFALRAPGGAIVALVPLVLATDGKLVMGGQTTPAPLLNIVDSKIAAQAEQEARRRTDGHLPLPIQMRPGARGLGIPPEGYRAYTIATYVVDLTFSERDLWKPIRKSYKNLINRAEKLYNISVHGPQNAWAVDRAHELHVQCAGGERRAARTWELMTSWVVNQHAVVAIATDAEANAVGYAYAIRYKQWAYYASGGSIVEDVQHALQWALIKTFRGAGLSAYELGYAAGTDSTTKDRGIAHFKAGFGSVPLACTVLAAE